MDIQGKESQEYFDQEDVEKNKILAVLSYIGILVIIPIFAAPDSKFVRFHANQGLLLLITAFIYGIARKIIKLVIGWIPLIGGLTVSIVSLIGLVIFVVAIIGIINAAQGKARELPIIGGYKIIK